MSKIDESGRPEKLTDELKVEIIKVLQRSPRKRAPAIQYDIQLYIEKKLGHKLSPEEKKGLLPGTSLIGKYVKPIRKPILTHTEKPDPLWNIGTLEQFPLSAESIPHILKVQSLDSGLFKVTIQQAKWIARLYKVIQDIDKLREISRHYAMYEKICKLAKIDNIDTSKFDRALMTSPKEAIELFEREFGDMDFSDYKKVFEQTTGVELAGVNYEALMFYIRDGALYAVIKLRDNKKVDVQLPVKESDFQKFIEGLKEHGNYKESITTPDNVTVITLIESVDIGIPSEKLINAKQNKKASPGAETPGPAQKDGKA